MRYKDIIRENDEEHQQALDDTGFWGKMGAGCIIQAQDTGRLLLPFRSATVLEPHTWGTWGGAVDSNETPELAVRREVSEEAGYYGHYDIEPLFVFKSGTFRFYNFLAVVDEEFVPRLDWETEKAHWFALDELPSPLHFGLESVFNDPTSMAKIMKHRQSLGGAV